MSVSSSSLIPVLADYGLSSTHGFLPENAPLSRLPDPYYDEWEFIACNLQALVLCGRFRAVVDCLPTLSTVRLEGEAQWRRAYSILCFMAHAYIWGSDMPADRLPPPISIPLLETSRHLELPPVATYAALCLWNFKPIFDNEALTLENMAMLNTLTGSVDESWFYMVSVSIEARGACIVPLMLTAMKGACCNDSETVTRCLREFAESLTELTAILCRMHENCDPRIFYSRIRPFLAGSKNMSDAGLPHGVMYEDGTGTEEYRQYSGGSNAQSSLIQFFDIVLAVEHRPTGEKKVGSLTPPQYDSSPGHTHNFIQEMRRYMPGPHARFLEDVAATANIRQYVLANAHDKTLTMAYDTCLALLSAFRDAHIAIVARYIIIPAREARSSSRSRSPSASQGKNLATASPWLQGGNNTSGITSPKLTGTGGTSLIPFLKQARDETAEPVVNDLTRRIMTRQHKVQTKKGLFSDLLTVNESPVEMNGLAGKWTVDVAVGGICQF